MKNRPIVLLALMLLACSWGADRAPARDLKLHGIFSSNMVLQRDKPILIWGWAEPGARVSVQFGALRADAEAADKTGRWEVTFPAREASPEPQALTVSAGDATIRLENIVLGDVWVMNGQSNMAWGLGNTVEADLEGIQAHLPLFREIKISANEQETLQADLPADKLPAGGWVVAAPDTVGGFSAIGYNFGARLQRALQIPIGIIDNARGGASIESLVPLHKFDDHPVAAAYKAHLDQRIADFDWDVAVGKLVDKWEQTVAEQRAKGVAGDKLPPKPTREDLRSWSIPGRSPSDAGSCYNGMFGVFKGLRIKGVLFHQGYNNAMGSNCRPKRYRVLTKLMVEGWREDFNDPALPVGIIGFCAGGIPQTPDNFEQWTVAPGAYIREAQRLGLADVGDPDHTAFLPAYDVQIPGLHPHKKKDHGVRAARWALNRVYGQNVTWDTASLVSAEPRGDVMVLTFDKPVMPHDMSMAVEGFSIADASGMFYLAHAVQPVKKDAGIWNTANKSCETTQVLVWSPLVKEPAAVRYGWATSPMGNLYVDGKSFLPLPSFRTDSWDWPEEGPETDAVSRGMNKQWTTEAEERLAFRKSEEARRAVEILERRERLGTVP